MITKDNKAIKRDTEYIHDEILAEKRSRKNLYKNTTRAKEILDTKDMMKEVVVQNAKLNADISDLKFENYKLSNNKKYKFSNDEKGDRFKNLSSSIRRFQNKLSEFENFHETEEIKSVLKNILTELSDYDN